jgi:glucokinase
MRIRDPRFSGRSYDVFRLAAENDPVAVNVVELAGKSVGVAIARLVDTFDPEIVVLGGGMSAVVGLYRESLEAGVRNFVWSVLHQNIPIVSAHLDVDSGVVGAALASIDRTE